MHNINVSLINNASLIKFESRGNGMNERYSKLLTGILNRIVKKYRERKRESENQEIY